MKIRLHGTEDECRETAELLESVMLLQSVSEPYPDRGRSALVRVYIKAIPARWAMTEAHRPAVELAQHYFRQIAEQAGMAWDGDNDVEVELMVGYVIDAAAARLAGQLDGALERIRKMEERDELDGALDPIEALERRQEAGR